MKRSDFGYRLPTELIAQYPLPDRSSSRLLYIRGGEEIQDKMMQDLPDLLGPGDLLIFNDTKVIPARLHGQKETGGRVEVLIERLLGSNQVLAQIKASKTPAVGSRLFFEKDVIATVSGRKDDFFQLDFSTIDNVSDFLASAGSIPLPPYIHRDVDDIDLTRYQTVFADKQGAVAAPTAGLHFDHELLARLDQKGIGHAYITLHVGAGTFQPLRSENVHEHEIHAEFVTVSAEVCRQAEEARAQGNRVIAVGTTVVRSLESAFQGGRLSAFEGETSLYILPGYQFNVVDGMLTNFHMPETTLLMLVCAFGGRERVLAAYQHAIEKKYRFYSYGDAMLLFPE